MIPRAHLMARRASCTVEARSFPTFKASLARVSWAEIARESSLRASPPLVAFQFMPMERWQWWPPGTVPCRIYYVEGR